MTFGTAALSDASRNVSGYGNTRHHEAAIGCAPHSKDTYSIKRSGASLRTITPVAATLRFSLLRRTLQRNDRFLQIHNGVSRSSARRRCAYRDRSTQRYITTLLARLRPTALDCAQQCVARPGKTSHRTFFSLGVARWRSASLDDATLRQTTQGPNS